MYILVELWFLLPNLCVLQLYVSSIVGASCGGLNEPEAWKLHVLGLCLGVCTFTCHGLCSFPRHGGSAFTRHGACIFTCHGGCLLHVI